MKKTKLVKTFTKLFFSFWFFLFYFLFPSSVRAQDLQDWEDYTYDSSIIPGQGGPGAATFQALEVIFSNILAIIFILAGFTTFIMLLVAGFRYLLSKGDPKATAQARGTLTWAIVGLLFLIAAWFILRLIKEFTGVDVTLFKIPHPTPTP